MATERQEINKCLLPFLPSTATCVVGPTGVGKSYFIRRMITQMIRMYRDPVPEKVFYCYGIDQPLFHEMAENIPNITFHKGLPTEDMLDTLENQLVVIDDLADELVQSKLMQNLIVRQCHHSKVTLIFVLHNIYEQGKAARTIALNSQYLVLFRNPRDMSQIQVLGRQMFPWKPTRLIEAYEDATKDGRGYLVVDFVPISDDKYRLRTNVFEDPIIYLPK